MAAVDGSMKIGRQRLRFTLSEKMKNKMFDDSEAGSGDIFPRDRILRLILDTKSGLDLTSTLLYFDQLLIGAIKS